MTALQSLVDLVLGVLVVETLFLAIRQRRPGRIRFVNLIANLAAGFFLVLALRVAVHDQGFAGVAVCLGLAGLAHLQDLRQRFTG